MNIEPAFKFNNNDLPSFNKIYSGESFEASSVNPETLKKTGSLKLNDILMMKAQKNCVMNSVEIKREDSIANATNGSESKTSFMQMATPMNSFGASVFGFM